MNPSEWNASANRDSLYRDVMRRSQERFFTCDSRFGTFKLRSALENVFVILAHNCPAVQYLTYEKVRVSCGRGIHIPDFLVNSEHLVECKARRDQTRKAVVEKAMAAERYAYEHDWMYHMLDYEDFNGFFELL